MAELKTIATTPYIRGIHERDGTAGLAREARRLLHKMETAAACYRDGAVKAMLGTEGMATRIERAEAAADDAGLGHEIIVMSDTIVAVQNKADPFGKAALILHTSEENWDRYSGYAQYISSLKKAQ